MRSYDRIVIKNTFFLYIMTGAKFVLPLIITAWLTRRLGPDSYGIISYLTLVMGYFILLFDFGFDFCATKKISQNRSNQKYIEKTIGAVYTAKILLIPVGLLLLFVLFLCVPMLRGYVLLTVLYYFSTAAQIFIPDFLYRGLEKMEGITKRYILAKFVTAVLILLAVRNDSQLILVPIAYFIGNVIAVIYTNYHMMQKLNQLYLEYPALYELDYDYHGFEWLVVDDHDQCVFAIERKDKKGNAIIAVMNFIGNRHEKYRVPVNIDGSYKEILNTDQNIYSGSNFVNPRAIRAKKTKDEDRTYLINKDHYIDINLAPFSACIFEVKPKTVKAVKQSTKETKKTTKKK